jgi:hypothetical protein
MPVSIPIVEVIAQTGTAMVLHPGDVLRVVDPRGKQVADLALYCSDNLTDSFSPGRTIDYNESIRISCGDVLYSNESTPLARVIDDTVGVHDMLLSPCSTEMFARRGEFAHPSCHANLSTALRPFGIKSRMVTATLNVFMDVRVDAEGRIRVHPPASNAGDAFAIVALRELLIGLAACASEKTNDGLCKAIAYELQRMPLPKKSVEGEAELLSGARSASRCERKNRTISRLASGPDGSV